MIHAWKLTDSQPKLIALNTEFEQDQIALLAVMKQKRKKMVRHKRLACVQYLHYGVASYGATHVALMPPRMIVIIRVLIALKI